MYYVQWQFQQIETEMNRLDESYNRLLNDSTMLKDRLQSIEIGLADVKSSDETIMRVCEKRFPSGLYQLKTDTNYGPLSEGEEYEISHVSTLVGGWNINAGITLNDFGIPTAFYFDYDGDGKIDSAIAARLVRELPIVGNTIADRLLADSSIHQSLYSVFSCEWRNGEFTSSDDMINEASNTTNVLWDLIQEYSNQIDEWISEPEMENL